MSWLRSPRLTVGAAACPLALLLAGSAQASVVTQAFLSPTDAGATGLFQVPAGVTALDVSAIGGKGGDVAAGSAFGGSHPARTGGYGATVSATLPVTAGETIYVYVAGNGLAAVPAGTARLGGANGGGASGTAGAMGGGAGGGGGASDVRTIPAPASGSQVASLGSRLLVAAGGGGAADAVNGGSPGNGNGASAGQAGSVYPSATTAQPGTAAAGGTGGMNAFPGGEGSAGSQGNGGAGGGDIFYAGSGGGSGLFGGGGGASVYGQTGAGGSSFVSPTATAASSVDPNQAHTPHLQIDATGHPLVTISYTAPPVPATTGAGGTSPALTLLSPSTAAALNVPAPPVAPILSALAPVHRCVGPVTLGTPKRGTGGLAFSFSLTEAADVTFTVLRRVGSPARTRCPAVRGHTRNTYVPVGSLRAPGTAGAQAQAIASQARASASRLGARHESRGRHTISLSGAASRRLASGTYVLEAQATNSSGQRSGVATAKFWVLK